MNTAPDPPTDCVAVQQDAAAVSVDWQGFTHPDPPGNGFRGAVFILDAAGQYRAHLTWLEPADEAADAALLRNHWNRVEPWRTDDYGRRVAAVHADVASPAPPVSSAPSARSAPSTSLGHRLPQRPAPTGPTPVTDRSPEEISAGILRSIDNANAFLDRLPLAAVYRTPPHHIHRSRHELLRPRRRRCHDTRSRCAPAAAPGCAPIRCQWTTSNTPTPPRPATRTADPLSRLGTPAPRNAGCLARVRLPAFRRPR